VDKRALWIIFFRHDATGALMKLLFVFATGHAWIADWLSSYGSAETAGIAETSPA
jgi:hypothetical protein